MNVNNSHKPDGLSEFGNKPVVVMSILWNGFCLPLYSSLLKLPPWHKSIGIQLALVIEECHKCLKTGCAVEQRLLTTALGLYRLLGFMAIVAVRLLHVMLAVGILILRPQVVLQLMLKVLVTRLRLPNTELTLGWFIGRKSNGNPGWQTL